jgi:cytochrome c-type biogenesis protein CcmH
MRRWLLCLVLALILAPGLAYAVLPDEVLPNPALETRARALSAELRCLVCQNQSIDDSAAQLARDLRLLVRERLVAGDSDQQVRDYLVARYGDFILLKPPLRLDTALLWGMPFLVLGLGAVGLFLARQRSAGALVAAPLSEAEKARLATLLEQPQMPSDHA